MYSLPHLKIKVGTEENIVKYSPYYIGKRIESKLIEDDHLELFYDGHKWRAKNHAKSYNSFLRVSIKEDVPMQNKILCGKTFIFAEESTGAVCFTDKHYQPIIPRFTPVLNIPYILGTSPSSGIFISKDSDSDLSHTHARFIFHKDYITVEDMNSTNGTFITLPDNYIIENNAVLRIGIDLDVIIEKY